MEEPSLDNLYLAEHVDLLIRTYFQLTGYKLIEEADKHEAAKKIYNAEFALLSHDTQNEPVFNYGNKKALELFDMEWAVFTSLQSRKSAEPEIREERKTLLDRVSKNGYIDDYSGIRISSNGKRFKINNATVWNLVDDEGIYKGQAATFSSWNFI